MTREMQTMEQHVEALDARAPARPEPRHAPITKSNALHVMTLRAPRAWDVSALWDESSDAVLWRSPSAAPMAGLGSAVTLQAQGGDRFAVVQREVERVLGELRVDQGPPARFIGGFSFAASTSDVANQRTGQLERLAPNEPAQNELAPNEPWADFADGTFVLPRWTYWFDGEQAWLRYVGPAEQSIEGELDRIFRRLESARPPADESCPVAVRHETFVDYRETHQQILRAIERGQAEKVVLARRADVQLARPLGSAVLLDRLARRFESCTRFAMRRGGAMFFGASPERLVSRQGRRVTTEALAGSGPIGTGAELLASDKERREHRLVVQAILQELGPWCEQLSYSPVPPVREFA